MHEELPRRRILRESGSKLPGYCRQKKSGEIPATRNIQRTLADEQAATNYFYLEKVVGVRRFDSNRPRAILTLKSAFGVQNAVRFVNFRPLPPEGGASVVSQYLSVRVNEQQMTRICC